MCSCALVTKEVSGGDAANGADTAEALSPQQRARAHAATYEAEFNVRLNMTDGSYRGKGLGIVLDYEVDHVPVHVTQINSNGLQAEWNAKHPDKRILEGDQITRVNEYSWHSNSRNFLKRISGLVRDGRTLDPASEEEISMHVLRPRRQQHVHTGKYDAEFVAEIPIAGAMPDDTSSAILGWKLNSTAASQPVLVSKIKQGGAVAAWNRANPEMVILEGDEVLKVNGLSDQSSRVSEALVMDQIEMSRSAAPGSKRTLGLTIRRPRKAEAEEPLERAPTAQETPAEQAPPPHQDPASPKQVHVRFPQPTSNMPALKAMGWQLATQSDSGRVVVKNVEKKGIVAEWNANNPSMAVEPNDQIIQVDGAVWQEGASPVGFLRKIAEALTAASLQGPGRVCSIALARPGAAAAKAEAARAATALSPGWESTVDVASGKVYYFNRATGKSSWTPV